MDNHSHEIYYIESQPEFSNFMRRHHGKYGMFFNDTYERSGKVAEDRPKTNLIENDEHEIRAVFYTHANPVRAQIVKDARNYAWSTHNLYAFGSKEQWMKHIKLPDWYKRLGNTDELRQRKYRQLFEIYLKETGAIKHNIFSTPFLGSPFWIEEKNKKISEWRKTQVPP